jgi:hypothetical protein
MALPELTPQSALLEEALIVLFCRIDDTYYHLNPKGRHYQTLKELSDSEIITLALLQQLRGIESQRSFLREAARFFSDLFPGVVGLHPSSLYIDFGRSQCGRQGRDRPFPPWSGLARDRMKALVVAP